MERSNIEYITIDAWRTYKAYRERYNWPVRMYNKNTLHNRWFNFDKGGRELQNLLFGKERNYFPTIPHETLGLHESRKDVIDSLTDKYRFYMRFATCHHGNVSNNQIEFKIERNEDDSISFSVVENGTWKYGGYNTPSGFTNMMWTQAITPNGYLKITIKFKNTISSEDAIFPAVFTIPSLPISTRKTDVTDKACGFYTASYHPNEYDLKIKRFDLHSYQTHWENIGNPILGPSDGVSVDFHGNTCFIPGGMYGVLYQPQGSYTYTRHYRCEVFTYDNVSGWTQTGINPYSSKCK
jgi:hypothetical protein